MYSLTRGKHIQLWCVLASRHAIPPLMIYPRKGAVPESMKIAPTVEAM